MYDGRKVSRTGRQMLRQTLLKTGKCRANVGNTQEKLNMEKIRIPWENGTKEIPLFCDGQEVLTYVLEPLCDGEELSATALIKALSKDNEKTESQNRAFEQRFRELIDSSECLIEFMSAQMERSIKEDKECYLDEDAWNKYTERMTNASDALDSIRSEIRKAYEDESFIDKAKLMCAMIFLNERSSTLFKMLGFFGANKLLRKNGNKGTFSELMFLAKDMIEIVTYMYNIMVHEALSDYIFSDTAKEKVPVDGKLLSYGEILSRLRVYRYIEASEITERSSKLCEELRQLFPDKENTSRSLTEDLTKLYDRRDRFVKSLQDQEISIEEIYSIGTVETEKAQKAAGIFLPNIFQYDAAELMAVLPKKAEPAPEQER